MKFARKAVVAAMVECLFTVVAGGWGRLVKKWEVVFAMEQEGVGIRVELVVRELLGQGVQRGACGGGKQVGEDVLGVVWEGSHGR